MGRYKNKSTGTNFTKFKCQKCGNEATRRNSKAVTPLGDGVVTGYTTPNKSGERREITKKGLSPRMHTFKCTWITYFKRNLVCAA